MEGDFHNLAGPGGNNTFLRTEGETVAESGVGAWQPERGINQPSVGQQHLDKSVSSFSNKWQAHNITGMSYHLVPLQELYYLITVLVTDEYIFHVHQVIVELEFRSYALTLDCQR